jgi:sugar/nucleoside kinase (ribokinase family)
MNFDVVGVGASCIDHVCRLPVFPEAGSARSKIRLISESRTCGGQTATALASCQFFGLRTKYIGVVGEDEDGARICHELRKRGIDTSDVARRHGIPTATATILIDDTGDRIVLWHRDPALAFDPGRLPHEALSSARLVHVDDVDEPAAIEAARVARRAGVPVACDLDHITDQTGEFLTLVSIPIFAQHVPQQLTGEADPERALRALRRRHPGLLVVTMGADGAAALDGGDFLRVPAFSVSAVDTTGAGDVFRGGLIYATLRGWPVVESLRFANAAAAASCLTLGAMAGVPDLDAVRGILESARRV